jgi:serine protease Do
MSRQVRLWSIVSVLVAGVGVAVATLVAQDKGAEPRDTPERRVFALDGRGSQLGVTVRDLSPSEPAAGTGGVQIDGVDKEGPAAKAGVQPGDIVVEFDGERVRSARQFTRLVRETPEGRAVEMALMRDGKRQTVTATPDARAFTWNMDIDGDRIRRDVERGLQGMREFRMDPPTMDFPFENGGGGTLSWTPRPSRVGVTLAPLTEQLATYFGAADGGALVSSVAADSPAQKAGLKAGDVITSVNGTRVEDARDAVREIRGAENSEITFGIVRDKQSTNVKVAVEPR